MPTFDEIRTKADNRALVRKAQKAVAFIAPLSVELPAKLIESPGKLVDLATSGFKPVGLVTPDGYQFSREVEKEDIDALGYASPVRSDVTKVPRSITMTLLEYGRKHIMELIYGTDLSNVKAAAHTNEIVFEEPDMPVGAEYRLLTVAADGPADDQWIMGKGFYRVKLTAGGGQNWQQEGAIQTEVTFDVFSDEKAGTPVRHYLGGTGVGKNLTALDYAQGD